MTTGSGGRAFSACRSTSVLTNSLAQPPNEWQSIPHNPTYSLCRSYLKRRPGLVEAPFLGETLWRANGSEGWPEGGLILAKRVRL